MRPLTTYKAHELMAFLQEGTVTSEALTKVYLDRIDAVDPEIKAYITVDYEGALAQAKAVDMKRSQGETLSIYAGMPIALKDNLCTKGLKTTCASKMLGNFIPPYDATVVQKIKSADMVILGKLNMDEFAMGSSTENSAFFKTANPYDVTRVPGGSSGGSAAAVAAGLTPWALGSDTGGSIRQPAHFCGVYGMKPTYGTVSRYGLVAFASSLDQIGPLTRDTIDTALLLNLIMGHDPMDSSSANYTYEDLTMDLGKTISGMKVGLPKEFLGEGVQPEIKAAITDAVKQLESLGAIVETVSLSLSDMALPAYYLISSAEASSNLARFDGIKYGYRAENYKDLVDLYQQSRDEAFGDEVKRRIMLGTYALSSGYYDAYYKKAQQVRTLMKAAFDTLFETYDVILTPTAPTTAFKMGEKSDNPVEMYLNDICTVPVNIAGVPAISVPVGLDDNGLPIGLQFIGNVLQEAKLLQVAHAFEQVSDFQTGGAIDA